MIRSVTKRLGPKDDPDEKGIVTFVVCYYTKLPSSAGPKDDPDEKGIVTFAEICGRYPVQHLSER